MKRSAKQRPNVPLRRQAPRRNRRRPNYFLLFCIFASVAAITGAASYVLTTPSLNITKIDIKGVRLSDSEAIDKAASRAIGRNILLVRTGPILVRIQRLSEVREVRMGRRFPNRLWLRVWERKPDAVLASNNRFYWTQSDGFIFHCAKSAPAGVPQIGLIGNERLKMGTKTTSADITGALQATQLACRNGIELSKITVDPRGQICLNMGSDFRVFLGYPEEIPRKMAKLKNALARRPSLVRDGSYIDLSTPSAPAWMPKVAAPT